MARLLQVSAAVTLAALMGCGERTQHEPHAGIRLDRVAVSEIVPYAPPGVVSSTLAVPRPDLACLVDGYDTRIVCGDRTWEWTTSIGREGRGPGELLGRGPLFAMPAGGLAFVDPRNARVTLFSPDLKYTGSVPFGTIGGIAPGPDSIMAVMPARPGVQATTIHLYQLGRGGAPDTIYVDLTPERLGYDGFAPSVLLRTADQWLLRGTGGRFVWLDSDAQTVIGVVRPPDYDPGLPGELDREDFEEDMRSVFGSVRTEQLERMMSRPRHPHPAGRIASLDHRNRLWILGNRPGDGITYFEIYEDTAHLGVVAVPGGVLAFAIVDSTLVALTRPFEPDRDGMRPRRLFWYDIKEAESRVKE